MTKMDTIKFADSSHAILVKLRKSIGIAKNDHGPGSGS